MIVFCILLTFLITVVSLKFVNAIVPDATVSQYGTGMYTSIAAAILAAPNHSTKRHTIYIKRGLYREYVVVDQKKWNLYLVGDGMGATIVSGNRSRMDGYETQDSATFAVAGKGFIARDMSFENTAGSVKQQAVAFLSDSEQSVLYRCSFLGYQDTLYARHGRQFFRECKITGTIDFIFGFGTVVFQNCQIIARKGLPNQQNTITANGRNSLLENTGFSLQFCNISVEAGSSETYLGRPWKTYSRTIILQSLISGAVRPEGWLEWNGTPFALDTLYYAEYMNYGPGAGVEYRIKWPGYHILKGSSDVNNFTVTRFIQGDLWLPSTGIPYTGGLG